MRLRITLLWCLMLLASSAAWTAEERNVRFEAVNVYVDSGEHRLAAYQLELSAETGNIKIVGLAGGDHPAFHNPPYYDPEALRGGRIILAAFDTGDELPTGRTRVARVHVMVSGETTPQYAVRLEVAGSPGAEEIPATADVARIDRDASDQ